MVGREVLLKGLGWIVGTGKTINVWSDPWLSTKRPLCPIGPPSSTNMNLKVSDLINAETNEWSLEAIRSHLPHYEDEILKLIPSEFGMEDELVWLHERTGVYSTKTGYGVWKTNVGEEVDDFNWRSCIWQVNTSPKLKHFMWKVKNKALPLGANLLRRGMEVEGRCKRCGAFETERHALLQCPFALRVWELAPVMNIPEQNSITSPGILLQEARRMVNLPPTGLGGTALYSWILWYLWRGRNKLVHEDIMISEQEIVSLAVKEARIWQRAQQDQSKPTPKKVVFPCVGRKVVEAQCFVDAAWNAGSNSGGFGCIFKDANNITTHRFSSNRSCVGSAFVAEALAVKACLKAARSLGLRNLTIWSDSKSLVMAITKKEKITEAQSILFDISQICNSFLSLSFAHVPRLNNMEADALAKAALLQLPV